MNFEDNIISDALAQEKAIVIQFIEKIKKYSLNNLCNYEIVYAMIAT